MVNEIQVIQQGFIIFCIVLAIWVTMQEHMIFEKISQYGDDHWPDWIRFPIYECPICGSPYYGSVAYWLLFGKSWKESWIEWIVVILIAMALATIFVKMKRK